MVIVGVGELWILGMQFRFLLDSHFGICPSLVLWFALFYYIFSGFCLVLTFILLLFLNSKLIYREKHYQFAENIISWCVYIVHVARDRRICAARPVDPLLNYGSVFQPFCCRGTLHRREDHSRNPMHWSVSPTTYARMKLRGIYGLISLAGHWGQNRHEDDKTDKDDQYKIWPH